MAIREQVDSRQMEHTVEGTFFRRIFIMTETDWTTVATFPLRVGNTLADDWLNFTANEWSLSLRITNVTTQWINQTELRVVVTYSTRTGLVQMQSRPDVWTSNEISFDMSTSIESVGNGTFFAYDPQVAVGRADLATPEQSNAWDQETVQAAKPRYKFPRSWPELLKEGGVVSSLSSAVPLLEIYKPQTSLRITIYSTILKFLSVKNSIGRINLEPRFLQSFLEEQKGNEENASSTGSIELEFELPNLDDQYKWLCIGANVTRVRADSWRNDFVFLYDRVGWNKELLRKNDGSTVTTITTNAYAPYYFNRLFDSLIKSNSMANIDPERSVT